jgi:cyanophycinase
MFLFLGNIYFINYGLKTRILKLSLKNILGDEALSKLEGAECRIHPGMIMAIGGAEDKSFHGKILKKFFELSGGKGINITIVPWASEKKEAGDIYKNIFEHFGAKKIFIIKEKSREAFIDAMERSAALFFVGGDQKRLLDELNRLSLIDDIKKENNAGLSIGGTSAGASILGEYMIYYSSEEDKILYIKGAGLVPKTVIDQHFSQRGRIQRLKDAIDRFSDCIGYGIDEDAAIVFQNGENVLELGSGKIIEHSANS